MKILGFVWLGTCKTSTFGHAVYDYWFAWFRLQKTAVCSSSEESTVLDEETVEITMESLDGIFWIVYVSFGISFGVLILEWIISSYMQRKDLENPMVNSLFLCWTICGLVEWIVLKTIIHWINEVRNVYYLYRYSRYRKHFVEISHLGLGAILERQNFCNLVADTLFLSRKWICNFCSVLLQKPLSWRSSLRQRFRILKRDLLENWFPINFHRAEMKKRESSIRPLPPDLQEFMLRHAATHHVPQDTFLEDARGGNPTVLKDNLVHRNSTGKINWCVGNGFASNEGSPKQSGWKYTAWT